MCELEIGHIICNKIVIIDGWCDVCHINCPGCAYGSWCKRQSHREFTQSYLDIFFIEIDQHQEKRKSYLKTNLLKNLHMFDFNKNILLPKINHYFYISKIQNR